MGIDGVWIGYEGTRSNYAKQQGRPTEEIFNEFREHGITILASMILGFDYQTPEVIAQELDGLLQLKPSLGQYLIYGPVPGTPFNARVMKDNLLHQEYIDDPELLYRRADGFTTTMKHPTLSAADRRPAALVFRPGFPAARPKRLPVLGNPAARLPEAQELSESPAASEGRNVRRRSAVRVAGLPGGPDARSQRHRAAVDWRLGAADYEFGPTLLERASPCWPSGPRRGPG
jgi:hypothetical protein